MLCITFSSTLRHVIVLRYSIILEFCRASHIFTVVDMHALRVIDFLLLTFVLFMVVISYPEKVRSKLLSLVLRLRPSIESWLRAQVNFFGCDLFCLSWDSQWQTHRPCYVTISLLSCHLLIRFLKLIFTSFRPQSLLRYHNKTSAEVTCMLDEPSRLLW